MKIFPDNVTTVFSYTETCFGLGYTIGPAIGSLLYQAGGFSLPFLVVGVLGLALATGLLFLVPKIERTKREESCDDDSEDQEKRCLKPLTLVAIAKVRVQLLNSKIIIVDALFYRHLQYWYHLLITAFASWVQAL